MAVLGLRLCVRAFSSCGKWGPLFIAVRGPLTIAASPVAEHRLQTRRLSSCGSRAQLLRGMWDPPRPGLEPVSPALAGRLSTTAPPGKPSFFLKIYLFIFGCTGSSLQCTGFSLQWPVLSRSRGSRHTGFSSCGCGLSSCGSQAPERRLSNCGARAQLLRGMWDLPRPGLEPMSPALAGGFLTTAPPGKSLHSFLKDSFTGIKFQLCRGFCCFCILRYYSIIFWLS